MQRISCPDGVAYYQFEQWQNSPLRHGVFTRHGGVSEGYFRSLNVGGMIGDDQTAVEENCRRVYATLGYRPEQVCTVWQVHGADVVTVTGPAINRKWQAQADGMITDRTDIALSMRFADCVPILFYDPKHHAVGIAHAGWRGTIQGVALSVLEAMRFAYDTVPSDVQVSIGPSIGPECYQVGEEVVEAVHDRFKTTQHLITRHPEDNSPYLNLWAANQSLLEAAGVEQIEVAQICTATHTNDFFSHRAEKGKTGRFAAIIGLVEL
ncbi:MAG: peptidoglycan editing factor PgeF [Phototrophicales bacterium]|nr:MAG: peptidoglycan editing factor PgeF [Phototrophicales bacterium]